MARPPRQSEDDRAPSRRLGALAALWPFLAPYRGLMALAGLALVLTAGVSLVLPVAVRRVVDNFGTAEIRLLDQYFGAALGIALLLALGTALRYYLVTRWASGWWPTSAPPSSNRMSACAPPARAR
jgi:ATP-binding cassette subfamily B protein